jgi:RimJ/RimL family protein N-acetyltransferase
MLTLVPFVPEHFATLSGWFATEADVVQWGGPLLTYPVTPEQLQAMLDESVGPSPARLCWMTADNGHLIGHAQLGFDWRHGNALLSRVAVAPRDRGRGLAIPMLRLVISKAFAFEAIERVELNVYAWNTPAIRTYERLNFRSEGIRRSSARVGEERWDTAIMGLLRSEWGEPVPPIESGPKPGKMSRIDVLKSAAR